MKKLVSLAAILPVLFSAVYAQQVIIKGTLRCMNTDVRSTRGAVNIIIIPSFNPKAAVATTTTPQGFFQINTGWRAKDLIDKEVTLFIVSKCTDCDRMQRVFISEDLDKRNTDSSKMYVTVKGWKILKNCNAAELAGILSERLLDSARHLPSMTIEGKATGSAAMGPVSFINLLEKLAGVAATGAGGGLSEVSNIPKGKISFGTFLFSSPMINTDNTGFNFSPSRNLSEAVFWNPAAIVNSAKSHNISFLSNLKNNGKLSGYQQITRNFYLGLGGIYTEQDQFRKVRYAVDATHSEKLKEYAAFLTPVFRINRKMSLSVTLKSVWQKFNNPKLLSIQQDNNGIDYNFFIDDSVTKKNIDADVSFLYKINPAIQAGISIMNVGGTKLYADMFIPGSANRSYVKQRAFGIGVSYKNQRFNVGIDALATEKDFYDASVGVNYVPFNNALISAGFAIKQKSFSIAFKLKHFRIAYISDNDLVINDVKPGRSKIFDGKIYSGFVFDF